MTIITIISAIALTVITCALTIFFCRKYVRGTFNSIDNVLDRVLAKDPSLLTGTTDEKRLSKLTYKARRIAEMCALEVAQTSAEKETIQGFIADMSHQMKTPLAGISMYADLLQEGNTTEEQQEFLSRIKSGTEKLQWIMDGLIKMSRLEAGAIQLALVKTGIKQTISDAIATVLSAAAKKDIHIRLTDFGDAQLYHDSKWTREAIVNILENAVKYTGTGGEINISVESLPLYTKIMITDNGIGINKDDWHRIFKRFYRGQNVKDSEGAGLGLYLASLIMEKQGGYIMVDSKPGVFTTFSLFLKNPDTGVY
ncbi:MAG: HAMP domain-containing histidine kinase [Firmicutes bacterium]|nr:HAMP domain-containing histidine kinase [Bacillota bacterium]